MRSLLASFGYPAILLLGLALGAAGLAAGFVPSVVAIGAVWLMGIVVLMAQRAIPLVTAWRSWWPDLGTDLLHASLSTTFGSIIAEIGARGLVVALFTLAPAHGPWPHGLPWVLQLAGAILLCDLLAYGLHRLSHAWEPLWRLHAMHHSSERLHMFSSGRTHPIYVALTHGLQALPLVALGAGPEIIALHGIFTGVNGLLQHCNADFRLGWLNRVFATCDLHRWHHSAVISESQTNFGNNLAVWDLVFGTWYLPSDRRLPVEVGLGEPYPRTFAAQVLAPFRRTR
jgi:sterol desaturase/sphingolipid hydroxylase (fatty acid hydroxylase superfamily)